ncbi:hypothetical protein D3C73_1206890 [compost metagenome]
MFEEFNGDARLLKSFDNVCEKPVLVAVFNPLIGAQPQGKCCLRKIDMPLLDFSECFKNVAGIFIQPFPAQVAVI